MLESWQVLWFEDATFISLHDLYAVSICCRLSLEFFFFCTCLITILNQIAMIMSSNSLISIVLFYQANKEELSTYQIIWYQYTWLTYGWRIWNPLTNQTFETTNVSVPLTSYHLSYLPNISWGVISSFYKFIFIWPIYWLRSRNLIRYFF